MSYQAIIIHPEAAHRAMLKGYLGAVSTFEIWEFEYPAQASQWLQSFDKSIDFVFLNWAISETNAERISQFRTIGPTKTALIFMIATQEDYAWIKTIFSMGELIDNIMIKPFRPHAFIQRIQSILKALPSAKPVALVVEDDPEARDIISEYLGQCGFTTVLQASDGIKALEILNGHIDKIAVVVSDWEMPSMNGIQLLRSMRENPRMASVPFVLVTSQTSIEQVKAVQAAEVGANGYLLKPFNLKTFRFQMNSVFQGIQRQKDTSSLLIQGRTLLAQGNFDLAIETINDAIHRYANVSEFHEILGDTYCHLATSQVATGRQNLELAVSAFETAMKLPPLKAAVVLKCFQVYVVLGKMNDAIRTIRNSLQKFSFDDELRTHLAQLYIQQGDYGAASVELRRAITLNPTNTKAQSLLQVASSLEQQGLMTKIAV